MRADGNQRHAHGRSRAGGGVINMPAAVQGQLRSRRAALPAVSFDINPRHAVGDVTRGLREEILKHNLRQTTLASESGQHDRQERPVEVTAGYFRQTETNKTYVMPDVWKVCGLFHGPVVRSR